MRKILVLTALIGLVPASAMAATPAEQKAEAVCTGAASIDDYPRWELTTDLCVAGAASTCTIEQKKDPTAQASYACPGSSDSGGGGGGTSPRPSIQE